MNDQVTYVCSLLHSNFNYNWIQRQNLVYNGLLELKSLQVKGFHAVRFS